MEREQRMNIGRIWYNYCSRHFWYYYFNWKYPDLPKIKAGKVTKEMEDWANKAIDGGL